MKNIFKRLGTLYCGEFWIVLSGLFLTVSCSSAGVLKDYVQAEDLSYSYSLVNTISATGYTAYVLDMNSQRWLTEAEVDRPLWKHWLTVIVPATINSTRAMLMITGGSNGGAVPTSVDSSMAAAAVSSGTVVGYLKAVPNQPLYFTDESISRSEDEIIAYSWDKYLVTGDSNWPVQLPMVNSAVKAMDAIQDFCAQLGSGIDVNDFVVTGASKRGWTTWLTGAVDSRVAAIIPIVIDMPNMQKSFQHHHAAYGFWAPAVHDYEYMGIFDWFDTPQMDSLIAIIDPYSYITTLTMPKYLVYSAGDDFFLPDSSQFYFNDLLGIKYLRYIPNTNHSLAGSDAFDSIVAFYQAILQGVVLPQFTWTRVNASRIEVQTTDTPTQVNLWQATNATARDFRLTTIGAVWNSTVLTDTGSGLYVAQVIKPAAGWTAFFVELVYGSGGPAPYKFTTEVSVLPNTLPYSCDFDFDGMIDLADIAYLAENWLQTGNVTADIAPVEGNGMVELKDFSICAQQWLK